MEINAFDGLKRELISRGWESGEADQAAASYLRQLPDNTKLTAREITADADQIERQVEEEERSAATDCA
jgi:uncharacterized protein YoaH (UPF0181 family)